MNIQMANAKQRLAVLWFSSAGVLFVGVLVLSLKAAPALAPSAVWSWYLPTVMPTLSLIIGVLVSDALGRGVATKTADLFLFKLTWAISAAYLSIVLITLLLTPFVEMALKDILDTSLLWLGPLQGLASAALGAFFVQSEPDLATGKSAAGSLPPANEATA
jgi:hypothetical protein